MQTKFSEPKNKQNSDNCRLQSGRIKTGILRQHLYIHLHGARHCHDVYAKKQSAYQNAMAAPCAAFLEIPFGS
ncbi:hypothetical protein [Undibacterium sp. JH2W]|uniref:hypothetical protein n=1 Tax=Undibacterium sp. JH2W TaxID=3413037 RepID=UPI003BF51DBC